MKAISLIEKKYGDLPGTGGSGLVLPDGRFISCRGASHDELCRSAKTTLEAALGEGAVRWSAEVCAVAVESLGPVTQEQDLTLQSLLRKEHRCTYLACTIGPCHEWYVSEGVRYLGVRQWNEFKRCCDEKYSVVVTAA